jgi:hypothetical protein
MKTQKISVALKIGSYGIWHHFCYVPKDIKLKFDEIVNVNKELSNYWIEKWAKQDFNIARIRTPQDMGKLKFHIRQNYKKIYPELYVESTSDKQGWVRVWYTQHMVKEIERRRDNENANQGGL